MYVALRKHSILTISKWERRHARSFLTMPRTFISARQTFSTIKAQAASCQPQQTHSALLIKRPRTRRGAARRCANPPARPPAAKRPWRAIAIIRGCRTGRLLFASNVAVWSVVLLAHACQGWHHFPANEGILTQAFQSACQSSSGGVDYRAYGTRGSRDLGAIVITIAIHTSSLDLLCNDSHRRGVRRRCRG